LGQNQYIRSTGHFGLYQSGKRSSRRGAPSARGGTAFDCQKLVVKGFGGCGFRAHQIVPAKNSGMAEGREFVGGMQAALAEMSYHVHMSVK
jgi:hypothetical protein